MKGYAFYAEPIAGKKPTRAKLEAMAANHEYANCMALTTERHIIGRELMREGLTSVFEYANSGLNWGSVSLKFLSKCTRISAALAYRLHPQLAERMKD